MRKKSLASLIQSLRVGAGIGAVGVVLHPGSAKQGDVGKAIGRAGKVIKAGSGRDRRLPAAPRGHGGRRRHPRPIVRGARRAARRRRRRQAPRGVPRLVPSVRVGVRRPHAQVSGRDARRVRPRRRARAARVAARERLGGQARLQPRPPRDHGRGRARREGLRGVPVRAALREAPVRARDRARSRGARRRGRGPGEEAPRAGQVQPGSGRSDERSRGGCPGRVRDHRRPGQEADVPLALPARATRAAGCAGDRCGGRRYERIERFATSRASRSSSPARRSTRRCSTASPGRLGYVRGDFDDEQTYSKVAQALDGLDNPTFYLEIPPSLFAKVVAGLAPAKPRLGREARGRREAVRA